MPNTNVTLVGIDTNLEGYSFSVNVPSMDPTDTNGSSGAISFSTGPLKMPQQYHNKPFTLSDSRFGSIKGRVSEVSFGSGSVTFTAETVFQRLTATSTIPPQFGQSTLDSMNVVLALGGFSCDGLNDANTDIFPGWYGSILSYVQMFCVARSLEYALDGDTLHFRPIRQNAYSDSLKAISYALNGQNLAQGVDVSEYTYTTGDDIEFLPFAAQDEPQVLTVETDGKIIYDVKINGWVNTVNQPTQVGLVGPETQDGTNGTYCVSGNDGIPVTVAHWTESGGKVEVEKTNDPSVLRLIVSGPSAVYMADGVDTLSPYSIAASAGDGNYYNALHVTGNGIRYTKKVHRFFTGATSEVTIEETGSAVENPFLSTRSAAYDVGVRAAQAYAGPTHTMTADTAVVAEYTDLLGMLFNSGQGTIFRVQDVTVTPSGESVAGSMDTTIADFNTTWAGKTIADFNTAWSGHTFGSFAVGPLLTDPELGA